MNTKKFMQNIYDSVSKDEPDVQNAERDIGEKIRLMTEEHKGDFSEEEMSLIRDMLYSVQTISMREGYILGAKHAAALFTSFNPKEYQ